ncbi:unnamed protein product [Mytilus coruscus]|uniref:Novel STAND NTPase 3 domain-containing protein n=1 Tax=Mytilus coruscus TaxID=42192 RepID=A0A6J8DTD8_MYTCO|nr:unnamed protein product [Mytilus coruscus]
MTHFTAFDDSCDSSALLGIIVNICTFPSDVQCDAKQIRSNIRNSWAHCDFSEWSSTKYANSFQLMEQLVKHLRLNNREENKILGELNKWENKREYIQTLCTEGENQFIRVQKELRASENDLQKMLARVQKLEIESKKHEEKIENVSALTTSVSREIEDLKAVVKRQEEDHIPKNIQAQYNREIQEWKNDEATFLETRATKHILTSLLSNDVIIVTGSSGCGKSSNIHHAALYLHERFGYEIIPVLTGPSDIINYNNENKKQVFVEDDICGKESINLQTLFMWRDYSEKLEKFFKTVDNDAENERDGKISELSGSKLLISCRLHIYKEAQFKLLKLLTRKECNLLSPEWCLQQQERMNMMQKYLPGDIDFIDNVKHVTDDVDFFPLICKLSKGKSFDEVIKLLTAPVDSITKNLNHIVLNNKAQFCALVLCILFDDGFNTDWLMLKSAPDNKKCKLVNIVKEFEIDLSSEIARNTLKAGFSTLDETYFKRRGKEYRLIHDIIYKMAAIICGNHLTECFIRYAPTVFIRDHFIFESIIEASANDDLVILSIDKEEDYF